MKKLPNPKFAGDVTEVCRRLEAWRQGRAKRGPIPAGLWSEAASLARRHGVNAIARALRLDYYSLKRQADATPPAVRAKSVDHPGFVEVAVVPASVPPAECVVELERADGARMRVRVSRSEDMVALSEAFWRWRA